MPLAAKEKVSMFCQVDKEQVGDDRSPATGRFVLSAGDLRIGRQNSLSSAIVTGRESCVYIFINASQSDASC